MVNGDDKTAETARTALLQATFMNRITPHKVAAQNEDEGETDEEALRIENANQLM